MGPRPRHTAQGHRGGLLTWLPISPDGLGHPGLILPPFPSTCSAQCRPRGQKSSREGMTALTVMCSSHLAAPAQHPPAAGLVFWANQPKFGTIYALKGGKVAAAAPYASLEF